MYMLRLWDGNKLVVVGQQIFKVVVMQYFFHTGLFQSMYNDCKLHVLTVRIYKGVGKVRTRNSKGTLMKRGLFG